MWVTLYLYQENIIIEFIQALQEEVVLNRIGKFIPYIFLEWNQLSKRPSTCRNFHSWVENFYLGGYVPLDPARMVKVDKVQRDKQGDLVWAHTSVL